MRFVKTPEEIKRIQKTYSRCHFMGAKNLTVIFETTPEAVRDILPPPLEPTTEAIGSAWVGEISNSNCVGPFRGAALYIRARYGDIVGNYCVTMPMSTPQAVTFGRELYGEPKKLASIIFEQQDEFVWGSAERHEIRFLSLRGRMNGAAATGGVRHRRSTSSSAQASTAGASTGRRSSCMSRATRPSTLPSEGGASLCSVIHLTIPSQTFPSAR